MTNIYLIRHAEAEGNLYRIAQGQYNSILTDRGRRQVEALSRRFADVHVDAVYASDLYRTCATASAIYQPKGLPLHRRQDLREICVGAWEQKTWGEIQREDPVGLEQFNHQLHLWRTEGAETPRQVRDRVLGAVRAIAAENEGKTVAVFSHGCAIRILLATLQGLSLEELGTTPHGENTAVSLVEAEGETLRVVFRDDASHLTDPRFSSGNTAKKHPNALEPGLYFDPLRLPEQSEFLAGCVDSLWDETARPQPFSREALLNEAAGRPALVGYLAGRPVGLIQFHPERGAAEGLGWISLLCVDPAYRHKGFGVQLLGQAVAYYRPLGRERLALSLAETAMAMDRFQEEYGFVPVGKAEDGRLRLEKDISYHPDFLEQP